MNKVITIVVIILLSCCDNDNSFEEIGLRYILNQKKFERDISLDCSGIFNLEDSIFIYNRTFGKPNLLSLRSYYQIPDSVIFYNSISETAEKLIHIDIDNIDKYKVKITDNKYYSYDKEMYTTINNQNTSNQLRDKSFLLRISEPFSYKSNIIIEYWFKRGYYCSGISYLLIFDKKQKRVINSFVYNQYDDRNG